MDTTRIAAWNQEMQAVHHRLEADLRTARAAASTSAAQDLLRHCYGFCAALTGHHVSEDEALFPRLLARHPELAPVVRQLIDDHRVLAGLITEFEAVLAAVDEGTGAHRTDQIDAHLDGIQAAMEAHFAAEERQLDRALDRLDDTVDQSARLLGSP